MHNKQPARRYMHRGVHYFDIRNATNHHRKSRPQAVSCTPAKRTQIGGDFWHICRYSKRLTTLGEVEFRKLPPATAGEVHLRLLLDAVFIACKHKDDLPFHLETATNCANRLDSRRANLRHGAGRRIPSLEHNPCLSAGRSLRRVLPYS